MEIRTYKGKFIFSILLLYYSVNNVYIRKTEGEISFSEQQLEKLATKSTLTRFCCTML